MKPRHQASRVALDLIERFEGFRPTAARLDDGRWTIGYGHIEKAREGLEIGEDDAETLLRYDLIRITARLNEWIYTELTQNQFDALVAFAFNIGIEDFRHSSVLRRINEGQLLQAACAMEMWRKAEFEGERIVIDALVRRRAAEKALFLTPPGGFLPAPTPVLRPKLDSEHTGAVPAHKPVEVKAALNGGRATAERIGPIDDYRPMPAMEPEQPMASEVAAEAVISRLQAIPAEAAAPQTLVQAEPWPQAAPAATVIEPEPEPEPELEPEATEPEPEPANDFALTPPPAELEQTIYAPAQPAPGADGDDSAPLFPVEPLSFDEYDSQRVAHHEFDVAELDEVPVERLRGFSPVMRWLALMVIGLVIFAAAILWGFNAKQMLVALVLGIVGIGCVATAVYFLLERLGGREEQ